MRLGDIEVVPLTDGTFRLDGGAMFGVVPRTMWEAKTPPDDRHRIALGLSPLLVRAAGRNVLIDAGVGDKLSAKDHQIYGIDRTVDLAASLAAVGLAHADIDLVIATHLHFDHAGGFTKVEGGEVVPAFPNARYVVRRGEWDDAMHPNERNRASYLFDNYAPLASAGVIDFVDDDGEVFPGISVWRTGGHTMHHQIVRIDSAGKTGLFVADLIPTVAHLPDPWIMGYDLFPLDTLSAKKRWIPEAVEGEYVIFFEHDPVITAGIIRVEGGKRRIEPIVEP